MMYRSFTLRCVRCRSWNLLSRFYSSFEIPFTYQRYPDVKRRKQFSKISDSDVYVFQEILSESNVITDEHQVKAYNVDWLRSCRGYSKIVLRPQNTDQLSRVLSYCSDRILAVCPQGGNTGLVGGSVPVHDEIIISMSLMNRIIDFDSDFSVVTVEAGVILENLDYFLNGNGFMAPLDLAAKGSCQIGGNVATNAGGIRFLRYGSLHNTVVGLEVVLANGEIIELMTKMKKDNTGLDLKQLFIGSEGTLGIISRVALCCPVRSNAVNLVLLSVESFSKIIKLYNKIRFELGEILSSCEFIDAGSIECVHENLKIDLPSVASSYKQYPYYLLVETSSFNNAHNESKLMWFLESSLQSALVSDGILATSSAQQKQLWSLRERISEALRVDGFCYKYDISIPRGNFYECVEILRERLIALKSQYSLITRCVGYGHLGDGNLHLNITSSTLDPNLQFFLNSFIFQWTRSMGGSISAEHGLGFSKRNFIRFSKSLPAISLMKKFKRQMDPLGILNPYKVLPED